MAAFVVAGVLLASPFEARADGKVILWIDCQHPSIKNESTTDMVTVEFFRKGEFVGSQTSWPNCKLFKNLSAFENGAEFKVKTYKASDAENADEVRVIAHGDNALYMDQVYLSYAKKLFGVEKLAWWGRNKGKGWCLSKDSQDDDEWEDQITSGGCRSCWQFMKSGTKVNACNYRRTKW